MKSLEQISADLGQLVTAKREQYGDSLTFTAIALAALYPHGTPPERMDDMLLVVRVLDKLQRLATAQPEDAESPWLDIAGYAICGIEQGLRVEELRKVCGSVSGAIARAASADHNGSAASPAATPTSESASPRTAETLPPASTKPSSSASASTAASAPIATGAVSREGVGQGRGRNDLGLCGHEYDNAELQLGQTVVLLQTVHGQLLFCDYVCMSRFVARNARKH